MQKFRKTLGTLSLLLVTFVSVFSSAQQPRFLSLTPSEGMPIVPIFEGWTANSDGSRSFSYGFLNRNETTVDLPLGGSNFIEPAEFNGMQPTRFPPGRYTGVFSVTVPANKSDIDVWWNLRTGDHNVAKIPGRAGRAAYELDFILPRPQGSLQPFAGFGENSGISPGLFASVSTSTDPVKVGSQVLLTVRVKDPSLRDSTDPRFNEVFPIGVTFNEYQGPAPVAFTGHPENIVLTPPKVLNEPVSLCQGCTMQGKEDGPNFVSVPGGEGLARVYATFSESGDYIIHARVDNFQAPESTQNNQCCWTNVFQKITVIP